MALVNCSDCNKAISSEAINCPKCGAPVDLEKIKEKQKSNAKGCLILFGIIVLIGIIIGYSGGSEENTVTDPKNIISEIPIDTTGQKARLDSINKADEIEEKRFSKTKAGRIQKKHPEWSKDDCINLANGKIWIGMDYDMLIYQRGKPDHVNTSDYGSGPESQCCWDNYTPSCFYMKSDNIITAYN